MLLQLFRTGVPAVDSTLGGIVEQQVTCVVGGPDTGKTWLALGFACAALERDEPVHYLTDAPLSQVCGQASLYLGRDLSPHLRSGRLTVQTPEGAAHAFVELSARVRERGVRCLVLDPLEALIRPAATDDGVLRAMVQELIGLGATCIATTRALGHRPGAFAGHVAARASANLELSTRGAERVLWVREALWSPQDGHAFGFELIPGVGALSRGPVVPPNLHPTALGDELRAYLIAPHEAGAEQRTAREVAGVDAEAVSPQHAMSPVAESVARAPAAAPVAAAAPQEMGPPAAATPALEPIKPPLAPPASADDGHLPASVALTERSPRRLFLFLFGCVALTFIGWRALLLRDAEHTAYSAAFLGAEALAMLVALWCYALMAAPRKASRPPKPEADTTVDVLILTYNEELDLVRHTILAARDMDEPHSVWVCDDGRRPELAEMCHEMRVGYITRENNAHYKAGNINNALAQTSGALVLILDADHVPRRALLTRLLGYFRDPKVAHVQVPQIYYNVDSFQHSLAVRRSATWHESSIFHHAIMHGLSQINATCFLGTGALIRRSALAEVGGVATGNITEDVLTGMRLHGRGNKSVFVDEPLATLLAPDTALAYAQQRLRWAQGNLEILRTENPLVQPGLSWRQRLAYLNTFGFYLLSYVYLLVYLVPGVYLFTGVAPLSVNDPYNVAVVAAFTAFAILNYLAMAYPHARLFHCECFKLLNLPINIRASMALFNPGGRAFKVTPKGFHIGLPLWVIVPIAVICLFNLAGLGYGLAMLLRGDGYLDALLLASVWAGFYGVASALTLAHTFSRRAAREPYAMPVSIAARLRTAEGEVVGEARVRRLCHELAYVEVTRGSVAVGTTVMLQLSQPSLTLAGRVQSQGAGGGARRLLRVELEPMTRPDWDALSRYLFETANPVFLGDLEGGCTSKLPPTPGERVRSTSQGVDFLPIRSEIV